MPAREAINRKMNDSYKSADGRYHSSDVDVIHVGHPEDVFALFDSETDRPASMSRRALTAVHGTPLWLQALTGLVGIIAGAVIGVGVANREATVTSDRPRQAPVAAATALPPAAHVIAGLSRPVRTISAVQERPGAVIDARRDASAPIAVARQRVAMRPDRARLSAMVATVTAAATAAHVAQLPIDAGPTIVVDDDTTPRPVTRVAPAAEDPVPAALFQLAVSGSASDPDGDGLTYHWSAPIGSFVDAAASRTTFTCPATPIEVPLTVTVTDTHGASASDTVMVRCIAAAPEKSR